MGRYFLPFKFEKMEEALPGIESNLQDAETIFHCVHGSWRARYSTLVAFFQVLRNLSQAMLDSWLRILLLKSSDSELQGRTRAPK